MNDFLLTTDSGCDLSIEECYKYNIIPLKMSYSIGDEKFVDEMTVNSAKGLYNKIREGGVPKTAQINSSEFVEFWKPLLKENKPILHICLGSGVSGTYSNAETAKQMILEETPDAMIYVVDSLLASYGYGALCMDISRMRAQGRTVEECRDWAMEKRHNVNTYYTTSDLKYLYRGGRVSRTGAVMGTVLNINPILRLDKDGCLKVLDKARGQKATERRMLELIKDTVLKPQEQTIYVAHSDIPDKAQQIAEKIKAEIGFKNIEYTYIGPIIGAHAGPGLVAVFFYGKPRT